MDHLSTRDVIAADLTDWRKLAQRLHARYRVADATAGAALVTDAVAVASASALADHLEVTLGPQLVDLRVGTDLGADGVRLTGDDVTLARAVSDAAARHAAVAVPEEVTQVEMGLDTADRSRVSRFWAVVLTGTAEAAIGDSVFDPTTRVPAVWFQETEPHAPPRQRWHPDVWVAPEVAEQRIADAVEAGGTVVDDSQAPSFTVLADADGNRVCVCTCLDRS